MIGCRSLNDDEISRMIGVLKLRRDQVLFILGVKTGFRVSELLTLKVSDVYANNTITTELCIQKRNTKRKREGRRVRLHPMAVEALSLLVTELKHAPHMYLFQSQKGPFNSPLSRIQAWRIIKNAANSLGLQGKVATHSWRKTFAQKVYRALGENLFKTQAALGHASIDSTVKYLDINREEIDLVTESI